MSFQLYVGNYPYDFSRDDLVSFFKEFEGVKLLKWFKKDKKSYSFFSCDDIEQVVSVIQKMNNAPVSGRKLIVRASDVELQKYVEVILQENKCDPITLKEKESHVGKKNTREISHNSSDSPPFVPMQVLRNKTAHKASQISCGDQWEANSSRPKSPSSHRSFSEHSYNPSHHRMSKSPSSHRSFSEHSYNPSHHRMSNNSFSRQVDDDDELKECVWLSVTNFPLNTPSRMIYQLFDDYAPLQVIMVCNLPRKDKTLTEAHVCFLNREVADDVIMNFDNTVYDGRLLLVNDVEDLTVMKELVNVVH